MRSMRSLQCISCGPVNLVHPQSCFDALHLEVEFAHPRKVLRSVVNCRSVSLCCNSYGLA